MPELPEVEVMVRNLRQWTAGRTVDRLEVRDPKVLSVGAAEDVRGPVRDVQRRGKYAILRLRAGVSLVMHFRMTGKVVRRPSDRARWVLHLDEGAPVRFDDVRRLGESWVLPSDEVERWCTEERGLGLEPYPERRDGEWWAELYRGQRGGMKAALLRQSPVVGLGNIAVTEAMWEAGLHPRQPVTSLSADDWERWAGAIYAFLDQTVERETQPEISYVNQGGPNPFRIYQRAKEPCPRCREPLVAGKVAGRGSWWCPVCQTLPRRFRG